MNYFDKPELLESKNSFDHIFWLTHRLNNEDYSSHNFKQYIEILTNDIGPEISNTFFSIQDAKISFLKIFGPYEGNPNDALENLRKNTIVLTNVTGPHIMAGKNLTRNDITGDLTEYYRNILIIVKDKTLLYGKLSASELKNILIIIDDHVRERHDPREWARTLGLARNLKELRYFLIPLSNFVKLLSDVIFEIELGRKIRSQENEIMIIS
jgi:hypothetical protein